MSPTIGNLGLQSPIIVAAGPWQLPPDLKPVGALVTKTITRFPRESFGSTLYSDKEKTLNNYGLHNMGLREYKHLTLPKLGMYSVPVFLSLALFAASQLDDLTAEVINHHAVAGVELNVSCPNAYGNFSGTWLRRVKEMTDKPIMVKLPPNPWSIRDLALEYEWADALVISNSIPALAQCGDVYGSVGMSGKAIQPITLGCIEDARQEVNTPIIACGGIESIADIHRYRKVGCNLFQVGSAHLSNPNISITLATLTRGN